MSSSVLPVRSVKCKLRYCVYNINAISLTSLVLNTGARRDHVTYRSVLSGKSCTRIRGEKLGLLNIS